MMKKLYILVVALLSVLIVQSELKKYMQIQDFKSKERRLASDEYVRDRVLKLYGEHGQCTGILVKAKDSKTYTLTASHCQGMINSKGEVYAEDNHKQKHIIKLIKEDPYSDLMLLTGIDGVEGIDIAKEYIDHQKVHAITHGAGLDSFRTDGEIVQIMQSGAPLYPITSEEEYNKCVSQPKTRPIELFILKACYMVVDQMYTTVQIVPGSSGGPLLNDKGELIGIASMYSDMFGIFVSLNDIHRFMK